MAKRDEIAKQGLIILDAKGVADIRGTAERLEDAGGRVLHRYGSRVLIGEVPPAAWRVGRRPAWRALVHTGAVREKPRGLTEAEAAGTRSVEPARLAAIRDREGEAAARGPALGCRRRGPAHPARRTGMTHVDEAAGPRLSARR